MKITVTTGGVADSKAALVALPFTSGELKNKAPEALQAVGLPATALEDFKASAGELLVLYTPAAAGSSRRVALLGLGEGKRIDDWRTAAAAIASRAVELKAGSLAIDLSGASAGASLAGMTLEELASTVVEGAWAGDYRFERLKSGKLDKGEKSGKGKKGSSASVRLATLQLLVYADDKAAVRKGADAGAIVGEAQELARDLVNLPGNLLQATDIAKAAVESGRRGGYDVKVFDKKQIQKLGMGGLLAVNKGSTNPPTFSVLDYTPSGKPKATIALVGKGITFDSGGISIKPSEGMGDMKSDMAGAASVIGAVEAAARLGLPVRVLGFIPSTDNMPDGNAQNPGDVITTYSGITVEVGNTDAEGRLILADALTYAKKEYKPDTIVDVATLTGACIVALGYSVAGFLSNDDELAAGISAAGERSGEKVWRLPLWELYDEQIKSDVADVHNTGGRGAGTITAAKFLEKFIDGHQKWAHIDIAGPSFSAKGAKPQGASGFGVRLLVELLKTIG